MAKNQLVYDLRRAKQEAVLAIASESPVASEIHNALSREYSARAVSALNLNMRGRPVLDSGEARKSGYRLAPPFERAALRPLL